MKNKEETPIDETQQATETTTDEVHRTNNCYQIYKQGK